MYEFVCQICSGSSVDPLKIYSTHFYIYIYQTLFECEIPNGSTTQQEPERSDMKKKTFFVPVNNKVSLAQMLTLSSSK